MQSVQAIINFFLKHGLAIMIAGFLIFFSSFLLMVFSGKYAAAMVRQGAFIGAIAGFSVYFIGRVSVFAAKRRKNKNVESEEL
jgi:uncharacterized membrane protein